MINIVLTLFSWFICKSQNLVFSAQIYGWCARCLGHEHEQEKLGL